MADTTFIAGTPIVKEWLNDVNDVVYGLPSTASAADGAGLSGFLYSLLYAQSTVGWGVRTAGNAVNVLRYIPTAQWANILNGTSTYDATANIQSALDSGALEVFFPGGITPLTPSSYRTTSVLTKPATVRMFGAGAYATAITAAHNGIIVKRTPATLEGDSYGSIDSMLLRNAATFTSSIGLSLANLNQASVSKLRIEGCVIGIQLSFVLNSKFEEVSCINATGQGLYIFSAGLATGNNRNTYKNFNFNGCAVGIRIDGTGTILSAFDDIGIETATTALQIVNGNNIVFNRLYLESNTNGISITGGDKITFKDCTNVSAQQWIATSGFAGGRVVVQDLYDLSGGGILVNPNVMVYDFGQIRYPSTAVASSDANTLDAFANGISWTPGDTSGAGLTFTLGTCKYIRIGDTVLAWFDITYPVTANGTNNSIGGLPFPALDKCPIVMGHSTLAANSATHGTTDGASNNTFQFQSVTHTIPTNANLSNSRFTGCIIYRA